MSDNPQSAEDVAILERLNLAYNNADEASDVEWFDEFLAEDFIVQTPGITRNREEYLAFVAQPGRVADVTVREVKIRILSDVALVHGRATYTLVANGTEQESLYTDVYQKREGAWLCVSACAIAPGS